MGIQINLAMKTKLLACLVLAGAMLLAGPCTLHAQPSQYSTNNFTFFYTVSNGVATIVGATGSGAMVIPGALKGVPVKSIGAGSFRFNGSITNVIITNGVTSIGEYAFSRCPNLTYAELGSSVTDIEYAVFSRCATLNQLIVDAPNPAYSAADGVLFDKNQTTLICCPNGLVGNYVVPAGVTNIARSAFSRCACLTNITIPSSVTGIGSNAFSFCSSLASITIPDTVSNIGPSTFTRCTSLTNVTLGANVTSLGTMAFIFCTNLTSIAIPDSVTNISSDLFDFSSGLTTVSMGARVAGIGDSAFWACTSLISVSIPNNVTNIKNNAFWYCTSLTNITIGSGVDTIGTNAFYWCPSLIGINVDPLNPAFCSRGGTLFNKSQTTLIQYPIGSTGGYTVPNGVTSIGNFAFSDSDNLSSVKIPGSVTNLGVSAFEDCENLTSLYFIGNAPVADATAFNYDSNTIVYYFSGSTGWSATLAGVPTALWNLQVPTNPGSIGVQANQFGFKITGTSNLVVVIEGCTNLSNPDWQPVRTNTLTGGSSYFSDPQWTNYPGRFYRLFSP
jgi:hypothetical protein